MASEREPRKPNLVEPVNESETSKQTNNQSAPKILPKSDIPPTNGNSCNTEKNKEHRLNKLRFGVEILTLIAVVFYGWVAYRQWGEMRRSTDASVKSADQAKRAADIADATLKSNDVSFRMTMRPYMTIKDITISNFTPEKKFRVDITGENSGKTPALNFIWVSKLQIGQKDFRIDTNYNLKDASKGTAGPNAQYVTTHHGPNELPKSMFDEINQGQLKILVHGKITYGDIFPQEKSATKHGTPYETTYCAFYEPIRYKALQFCSFGNSMK